MVMSKFSTTSQTVPLSLRILCIQDGQIFNGDGELMVVTVLDAVGLPSKSAEAMKMPSFASALFVSVNFLRTIPECRKALLAEASPRVGLFARSNANDGASEAC